MLSEFYDSVTVVERDKLPDSPSQRKGVPQGRHVHMFLSRGTQALAELFPGLLDELAEAGAVVVTDGDLSRIYARVGGWELKRSGRLADPTVLTRCLASRPFVEFHVRRRVMGLPKVTFLDGHDAVEPLTAADAVAGVRSSTATTGLRLCWMLTWWSTPRAGQRAPRYFWRLWVMAGRPSYGRQPSWAIQVSG